MAKTVDLARMAELLSAYPFAFLVTVGADHRPHTATVTPRYRAGVLEVDRVGRHGRANLAEHRGVTLVFPARDVSDYSLLVDGDAEVPDDPADPVVVHPVRALLHRPVRRDDEPPATGSVYDCVPLARG